MHSFNAVTILRSSPCRQTANVYLIQGFAEMCNTFCNLLWLHFDIYFSEFFNCFASSMSVLVTVTSEEDDDAIAGGDSGATARRRLERWGSIPEWVVRINVCITVFFLSQSTIFRFLDFFPHVQQTFMSTFSSTHILFHISA